MNYLVSKISSKKRSAIIIVLVFIMAIVFETFQQLYYINRFNLADDVSFFSVLKTQSYKWLVWVLVSTILIWYVKINSSKKEKLLFDYLKYGLVIFGLVFLSILIISAVQLNLSNESFSLTLFFAEYVTFFSFQKAPIYTLGYIAIAIIVHFYFTNEQLEIKVQELSELKDTNEALYKKLSQSIDDKTSVLNIKIGNKRKIIATDTISWIEADDYCVKVYSNASTYIMRSSLKALENKLDANFLRVHRKAIVNMRMAKELRLNNSPRLILENNSEIPVSKSNLKLVKDFLN